MAIDQKLSNRLQALPAHSPGRYNRLPLDPRLARKFARSPGISAKQGKQLIQYAEMSKWVPDERAVYSAVVDGFTTTEELVVVTGLPASRVGSIVGKLTSKGLVKGVQ